MIISQTPFRISFFGGGTDYGEWVKEHGGAALATSIDKYCYITVRKLPPFFSYRHRLVYSVIEMVNAAEEIKHPAIRECMRFLSPADGVEIHHDGDLPARSGLGSSSAFTVGMLNALHALQGRMVSKYELARQAIHVEQEMIGEPVGVQDQIATCFGGFNRLEFRPDGGFSVSPVILPAARLEALQDNLMLFFTGFQRDAFRLASKQIQNIPGRKQQLFRMRAMVDEATSILTDPSCPLDLFGRLLNESWRLKREMAEEVSNSAIDGIYEMGLSAGALGGKLLGAGGGGFMLFFVRPEHRAAVRERLSSLVLVDFAFESMGSRILLYDPNY